MDLTNKLLAQATYHLTGPGITPSSDNGVSSLEDIVSQVIGILSIVAVLWFVIQVILAGYAFLSSQGDPKKTEAARTRLTESVLGLTVVIVAIGLGSLIASLAGLSSPFDLNKLFNDLGLPKTTK